MNEADIDDDSSTSASRALPVTPYAPAMLSVVLVYWTVEIVAPALPAIRDHFGLSAAGPDWSFSFMFRAGWRQRLRRPGCLAGSALRTSP
ncbi:MAG: hypothetical protein R2839_05840 [Thermomicrobiales bacterium]